MEIYKSLPDNQEGAETALAAMDATSRLNVGRSTYRFGLRVRSNEALWAAVKSMEKELSESGFFKNAAAYCGE